MDYLDLKFALARKGYTLTRVAQELGLGAGEAMRLRQEAEREARAGVA